MPVQVYTCYCKPLLYNNAGRHWEQLRIKYRYPLSYHLFFKESPFEQCKKALEIAMEGAVTCPHIIWEISQFQNVERLE